MTKAYLKALAQLKKAKAKLEEERINMQLSCKHENVAEIPYSESLFGRIDPPYRICADCGFAEKSWSCGNQILVKKPNMVEANVIGKIWNNHTFVVSTHWKRTGKAPQNKQEAFEMAVKGILPKEYLDEEGVEY